MSPSAPPRRFQPEPVETSSKSSRKPAEESTENANQKPRKFAPELLETTINVSNDQASEHGEFKRPPRKFAPEPVETNSSSRKAKDKATTNGTTKKRFSPQLVETTKETNRSSTSRDGSGDDGPARKLSGGSARKFSPQLMETSKRSRKSGDSVPTVLPSDATDFAKGGPSAPQPPADPPPPSQQSPVAKDAPAETRRVDTGRQSSSRGDPSNNQRQHSFRVPELDPIESSESEEDSNPPGLSDASSSNSDRLPSTNTSHESRKDATRMRESADERFSGYMLRLAAQAAEKQLRDQAMAAFPNSDFHEPVDHYVDHDDSDSDQGLDDRVATWEAQDEYIDRRETSGKVNWELIEMQRYQERLEKQRQKEQEAEEGSDETPSREPWWNPVATLKAYNDFQQKDELKQMRNAASPPMLGDDILFPRCPSPEPARFDVTQGSAATRNAMCYLTEQSQAGDAEGLWTDQPQQRIEREEEASERSKESTDSADGDGDGGGGGGLWHGFCHGEDNVGPPTAPLGLMTPHAEPGNPFDRMSMTPARPVSPNVSNSATSKEAVASLDAQLNEEKRIEEEFSDEFVTQVFNYLSLGYPALARPFDHELEKISHIDVVELRQDDKLASTRGYILLGEEGQVTGKGQGVREEQCARWRALRRYIREWARQRPRMEKDSPLGQWGVGPRRGSWAF
ncbi:MAG: hypothetical protein M1820_003451 [Bogoriella megaspora]|nr:MAG: hypothetical protein M1820_003451 [Bogoriella megaspora]